MIGLILALLVIAFVARHLKRLSRVCGEDRGAHHWSGDMAAPSLLAA